MEAALKVGIKIEELDITDLERELKELEKGSDISTVYTNLNKASYNHLNSFILNLQNQGISYESNFILQENIKQKGKGQNKVENKNGKKIKNEQRVNK